MSDPTTPTGDHPLGRQSHQISWMTGAHFRWGAVSRLDPGSSRLRLLIYPPGTTDWQRRCASTAAVPICGWGALAVGLILIVVGLATGPSLEVALGLFVLCVIVVTVGASRARRGAIELIALDPQHQVGEPRSRRLREPSALMAQLVNADSAFRDGRISRQAYQAAWRDAYERAVRLTRSRRS